MLTLFSPPPEFPILERLSECALRDAFIASAGGASILTARKNMFDKPYVKSKRFIGGGE